MTYSTILVTGGAGLIGRSLTRKLLHAGHEVLCFDRQPAHEQFRVDLLQGVGLIREFGDITYPGYISDVFHRFHPKVVFHLASVLGVANTEKNPERCYRVNVEGTNRVLDLALRYGVERLIFASSSEVYGEGGDNIPLAERAPLRGNNVYALSKIAGEAAIRAAAISQSKMTYTIARLFNTYGPRQIAQFVVPRFVNAVLWEKKPLVYDSGVQTRSFCYVDDTAEALMRCMSPGAANKIFNIGGEEPITIRELAIQVCNVSGGGTFDVIGDFTGADRTGDREVFYRICDAGKAKQILDWHPQVSLNVGIAKMIQAGLCPEDWA